MPRRRTRTKRKIRRHTRKQSGRGIDMAKLKLVLNHRSRASQLANDAAKKAQMLKEQIELI